MVFVKTVQPNNFSKLVLAACSFKNNNTQETFVCLRSLILSFTCNFFAYFKFHSDFGRVIGKIKQNELDCRDTAPLTLIGISRLLHACAIASPTLMELATPRQIQNSTVPKYHFNQCK